MDRFLEACDEMEKFEESERLNKYINLEKGEKNLNLVPGKTPRISRISCNEEKMEPVQQITKKLKYSMNIDDEDSD